MRIKLTSRNDDGTTHHNHKTRIQEVIINEDLLHPGEESISVIIEGESTNGIVDFTPEEFESVYDAVKGRLHLIKGFKRLTAKRE